MAISYVLQGEELFTIKAFDQDSGVDNSVTYEIDSIVYDGMHSFWLKLYLQSFSNHSLDSIYR